MAKEKATTKVTSDKKTLGVTRANERPLARLVEAGSFGSELDAARFAMAFAIDKQIPKGMTEGTSTKWNVGTFDNDGTLRLLTEALYDDATEPYRLIEHLVNEGLRLLDGDGQGLPDVIGILSKSEAARAGKREVADDASVEA